MSDQATTRGSMADDPQSYCRRKWSDDNGRQWVCMLWPGHILPCGGDGVRRTSVPRPPVHLHGPVSGPVCGAEWPADRMNETTAYRSEVTCPACLARLRH